MRLALAFLIFALGPLHAQEEADPLKERNEWSIKAYSFPSYRLQNGFASRERGQLYAPELPAEDASEEEIDSFLNRSNQTVGHFLEMEGISLPDGSLVAFDRESLTLVARVPGLTHWSLGAMAEALQEDVERIPAFKGTLLEAPRDAATEMVEKASFQSEHAELLAELLANDATAVLHTAHLQCRSGQRARVSEVMPVVRPQNWLLQESGMLLFDRTTQSAETGTVWELDSQIGPDGITMDVNFSVRRPLAPTEEDQEVMTTWQEKEMVALHRNRSSGGVTTSLTIFDGQTKLVGVWPSLEEGKQQCAFLEGHAVKNLPLKNERLLEMMEARGEAVMPIPEGEPNFFEEQVEGIPEGMFVQRFRIPPSFLGYGGGGAGVADDPFAGLNSEPTFTIRATAKDILQSVGIVFPPGSSANYIRESSELVVRNTPENLDLVSAYVETLRSDVEAVVLITAYVLEAPRQRILQLADESLTLPDHRDALRTLREADDTKMLSLAWTVARSGQRAKVSATRDINYMLTFDTETASGEGGDKGKGEDEKAFSFSTETEVYGTVFEVDPQIGPDGYTIDLNVSLDYDFAPPEWQGEVPANENQVVFTGPELRFNRANQTTALTLLSGAVQMVGHWKPEGNDNAEDVRQVAFVRAALVRLVEEEEESRRTR